MFCSTEISLIGHIITVITQKLIYLGNYVWPRVLHMPYTDFRDCVHYMDIRNAQYFVQIKYILTYM